MDTAEVLESPRLPRSLWWMLTVSCLAVALVIASMAALYTALPSIAVDIGAGQAQLTWIVDGYTLALACLVLPAGALGDRYGRRRALIVGLLVFSVASVLPLLVADPIVLIAARASAGVGAALIMPSTLSIMTAGFPPSDTGRAVGIWAGIAGGGGVLGIIGSGALLQWWSWHSIFAALAGAGAVLLVIAFTLPESREADRPPLDPIGSACVAVGLGLAVVGTIEAPLRGWLDVGVLGLFAGGAVALVTFVLVELRSEHPLLDIRLLALRGFGSGAASITIEFLAIFGVFLLLVQYLQLVLGYSALQAATAMGPMIVPLAAISVVAPWLADRIGPRVVMSAGMVILAGGLFAASRLDGGATYLDVLWPLLIMSVGIGLGMAPPTALIMTDTPMAKQGVAAAVNDAARELGAAIGIAVAGSVLAAGYRARIEPALPRLPEPARGPVSESFAAALELADRSGPVAQPLREFAEAAFVHGISQAAFVLGCVVLVGAVPIACWAPGRKRG
ncbi:MFS transporter [Nocardia sp. NBC_00565]|uniref:MFS transporter n=1 Tax=Nocardia sp. NBC_00565 TaxID=2975993 RepID=UPI002E81E5E6|nr:MFS transporter [Nocardia sp. NBC_00565]WUC06070.1 MFS transporter [Nocardia sp. NBC_00565]